MTTEALPTPGMACRRCNHLNRGGDRFCESCGAPLAPAPIPRPVPTPRVSPGRDATTRYLCAAAQLDAGFADRAIGEYLVERTRAVPPSPGVDTAAVLREAVAARYRRNLRDAVLLVLSMLFVIASPVLAVLWALVGGGLAMLVPDTRGKVSTYIVLGVAGLAAIVLLPGQLLALMLAPQLALGGPGLAIAVVLGLLIVAVVLTDATVVHALTRGRFRDGVFQPNAELLLPGWERTVRQWGHADYTRQLQRIALADDRTIPADQADVVVHRSRRPFIGSGRTVRDEAIALPLEPNDDCEGPPKPFTVAEFNEAIAKAMIGLRGSASLSPGRRLAGLTVREQVFIPADRLVLGLVEPPVSGVLPDMDAAPLAGMPIGTARVLADRPQEAARYYLCCRIEAWDRDLAISCFVTAGTDQHTLYVEWAHCALLPLREEFRSIDRPLPHAASLQLLSEILGFPGTVPHRLARLLHVFTPLRQGPGEVVPDRYGAAETVREMAADGTTQSYFQDADAVRYMQLVEQALFRAIGRFLDQRGYSITDALDLARAKITNAITIQNSTIRNSAIGIGRTSTSNNSGRTSAGPQGQA